MDRAYISSVRPHIDIPWSLHGRIKDYADEQDMTLTEAYESVLNAGLESLDGESQ